MISPELSVINELTDVCTEDSPQTPVGYSSPSLLLGRDKTNDISPYIAQHLFQWVAPVLSPMTTLIIYAMLSILTMLITMATRTQVEKVG